VLEPSQGKEISPVPSADLAAYDALPPELRAVVAASPWPLSSKMLAELAARSGTGAARRVIRQWERQFAEDHAWITAEACER
jgi:hypothetical protein